MRFLIDNALSPGLAIRWAELGHEMGVPPVQIHVMSAIDGVNWDDVWATREEGMLGTHAVALIGRDCFLRNKRAAGRPKDLADIEALRDTPE